MADLSLLSGTRLRCLDAFEFVIDGLTVKGEIHCSAFQMLVKIKTPFEIERYIFSPPLAFAKATLKLYAKHLDKENLTLIEDGISFAKKMYLEHKKGIE